VRLRRNSANAGRVQRARPAVSFHLNLEKILMLWLFLMLAAACVVYVAIATHVSSIIYLAMLIALVGGMAALIAHFVLFKPMREISAMAKSVGAGDFSKRLRFSRRDEIGCLALDMDTMCDQLQAAEHAAATHIAALEQLRQSDRVATLGRLASSVAHELGNPLNVIELRAQLISCGDAGTLQQAQSSALVIVEQTRRMTKILNEILSFARAQPANIARLDVLSVVRKAIALSEHISKKHGSRIGYESSEGAVEIDGDADKLLQILVNLIVNGVQSMPRGGVLTVSVCARDCAPIDDPRAELQPYVCIDVLDHGVGIPAESLSKIFEPFFSTRGGEGGTGLGLSVAQGIAREHSGWISVESETGRGSTFTLHLPKHCHAESSSRGN
jgi:two-component system, NtrC family, sensor kinase